MDFLPITERQHSSLPANPERARFFFGQYSGGVSARQVHTVSWNTKWMAQLVCVCDVIGVWITFPFLLSSLQFEFIHLNN